VQDYNRADSRWEIIWFSPADLGSGRGVGAAVCGVQRGVERGARTSPADTGGGGGGAQE
jgi:hypothetical protein